MTAIDDLREHLAKAASGYAGDEKTLELTTRSVLELADQLQALEADNEHGEHGDDG